jgi:hypothetical protein
MPVAGFELLKVLGIACPRDLPAPSEPQRSHRTVPPSAGRQWAKTGTTGAASAAISVGRRWLKWAAGRRLVGACAVRQRPNLSAKGRQNAGRMREHADPGITSGSQIGL